MDCSAAREMLALIRPDSGDGDQPQLAPAMVHLQQCADCQAALDAQQKADRELSQAMRRVSVPVDLKARLLAQLATATAPQAVPSTITEAPTSAVPARPAPRRSTRRQAMAVVSAALLVLAFVGGWWYLDANRKATLAVHDDLLNLSHLPIAAASPKFEGSFQPELPVQEIRMPSAGVALQTAHSLRDAKREIGAIISYQVQRLRGGGGRVPVILVVVNLRRVEVPDLKSVAASFQLAVPVYHRGYATRVWRSGQNLYVCYALSRDPEDLESLKYRSSTT